ncbi:VanZ like family protein [Carnobacterium iners]|uniref:VanZ like family protein n=1 Tax=Carnobacterium iners TaxID=1073423 RepID=A0A1X7NSI3_9LACT|nr:VanZ family protein [Carnobacterium iners]SEL15841.1 VanZ like family protein [Carnobacterium iners]SMH40640.1 VanZ like family protein [Carnobacterium iners]
MRSTTRDNSYILLALVIMGILFYSSSQPYEEQSITSTLDQLLAKEPMKNLLSTIQFSYADSEISISTLGYSKFVEFFIRKAAHFVIYFLLGLFWFLGLKNKLTSTALTVFISWLLATGYAAIDEFHQGITPNRTPLLQDIQLDSIGAATGIILALLFFTFHKRNHKKRNYKSKKR